MTEPTIHPVAASGFAAGADAYERARPSYPPDAVAAMIEHLGLGPGRTLLELGAGTGKLTRLLAPSGVQLIALEPVARMRALLEEVAPEVTAITGTAEAIPLPNGSVDAVVVAQAFHWFDAVRALSEIHRVLRPGGVLGLAWNRRDTQVPWVHAAGEVLEPFESQQPGQDWPEAIARCGLFDPMSVADFRHAQALTRAGIRDRFASISFVAAAEPEVRDAVLEAIDAILDADPATAGAGIVELPYDTRVMWAVRRSIAPGTEGIVASVNRNGGGVPKPPVDGARILRLGLEGDGHTEPEPVHGGPDQAVCLYPQEAIERVRADGHQAFPGAFGENLTLLGIDWRALQAGDRLEFGPGGGDGPILELVDHAAPCQTIAHWFTERRISRISGKVHPDDARWYARVIREGDVAPSMAVRVLAGGD